MRPDSVDTVESVDPVCALDFSHVSQVSEEKPVSLSLEEHKLSDDPRVCFFCGWDGPRKRFYYFDYPEVDICVRCASN